MNLSDDEKKTILYLSTLDSWGQLSQLQEECAEVIAAVNRLRRKKPSSYNALCEEIADLRIMLAQMEFFLDAKLIDDYTKTKLERIKERFKNGQL